MTIYCTKRSPLMEATRVNTMNKPQWYLDGIKNGSVLVLNETDNHQVTDAKVVYEDDAVETVEGNDWLIYDGYYISSCTPLEFKLDYRDMIHTVGRPLNKLFKSLDLYKSKHGLYEDYPTDYFNNLKKVLSQLSVLPKVRALRYYTVFSYERKDSSLSVRIYPDKVTVSTTINNPTTSTTMNTRVNSTDYNEIADIINFELDACNIVPQKEQQLIKTRSWLDGGDYYE